MDGADGAPQPLVEAEKVDPSKAGTLEAAAKPEPPPPAQEEKKTASKSSFLSLFKPKAAEPKKATSAPGAAAAGAAGEAKEEPKAAAKSSEAGVDNKQASAASQAGDDAASVPKNWRRGTPSICSLNPGSETSLHRRRSPDRAGCCRSSSREGQMKPKTSLKSPCTDCPPPHLSYSIFIALSLFTTSTPLKYFNHFLFVFVSV
ncbi:hypothetical protein INR49_006778 [Caranx melampygus]|nr:hypothetical protein INR49_006778 [Caranx melampygus]